MVFKGMRSVIGAAQTISCSLSTSVPFLLTRIVQKSSQIPVLVARVGYHPGRHVSEAGKQHRQRPAMGLHPKKTLGRFARSDVFPVWRHQRSRVWLGVFPRHAGGPSNPAPCFGHWHSIRNPPRKQHSWKPEKKKNKHPDPTPTKNNLGHCA